MWSIAITSIGFLYIPISTQAVKLEQRFLDQAIGKRSSQTEGNVSSPSTRSRLSFPRKSDCPDH